MLRRSNKKVVYLKPKKKSIKLTFLIALSFSVLVIIYLCRLLFLNTYIVSNGEISESFSTEGIIIKNEMPILSPAKGKVQLLVKSGERVRVGTPLFIVTTDEEQKQHLKNEISEIEEKIKAFESDVGSSSLPLNLIKKSIESTTQKLKEAVEQGEFDRVRSLQDELTRLTKEKQKLEESNETNISLLKEQLDIIKEELNKIDIVVYASEAGIVSLNIDGLEEILVPERARDISYTQLMAFSEGISKAEVPTEVKMNQPVLKIIDNFSWYVAFKPKKDLKEGRDYYIKIENGEKIKAQLTNINEEGIGFFLINSDIDSLLDSRIVNLEVFIKTHSGCMIPKEALFYNDGQKGVYVIERGERCFKPIELVIEDENYLIVDGLKQGDKIILNKRGLDELFKAKYSTYKKQN